MKKNVFFPGKILLFMGEFFLGAEYKIGGAAGMGNFSNLVNTCKEFYQVRSHK